MNWQEKQAEIDQEGQDAIAYYEENPAEWPICQTCGKVTWPQGTIGDRVEFHCGVGGHTSTIMGKPIGT